jgi:LysM repeat protein
MRSPVPVRLLRAAATARLFLWFSGAVVAAAFMWLSAALFGGATAVAATPAISIANPTRHKTEPSITNSGRPHQPRAATLVLANPAGPLPEVQAHAPGHAVQAAVSNTSAPATTASPITPAPTSDSVWDRVAQCESGGRWSINTGNGHYGGLQFTQSTWRAFGGGKYASTANKATKAQQIEIAEKVLAGQGPGAWPTCGKRAGLTRGHANKLRPSRPPAKASPDEHKNQPSPNERKTAEHKNHDKDKQSPTKDGKVVVRPGDTLAKLAAAHKVKGGWHKLYEQNRHLLNDPNKIRPGQELTIPSE